MAVSPNLSVFLAGGLRCRRMLVLEVTEAGKDHRHVMAITVGNRILIFDGTTRLNHCPNPGVMGNFDAIREWKKCI